jgi:hypothetical protein
MASPSDIGDFVIGVSPIGGSNSTTDDQPFPPSGPTTTTAVIPSYPYAQYTDDTNGIIDFFNSYNQLAQTFVNTVNALNLPIYTSDSISGLLLDWVGAGIYGFPRPTLSSGLTQSTGELNTTELNTTMFDGFTLAQPTPTALTSDDIYKRCLTWLFWKGDGKYFTVRWLKRRIMRFIMGTNGTAPNVDQTYQISVSFGPNNEVTIRFIDFIATLTKSATFNTFELNSAEFNEADVSVQQLTPLPFRQEFQDAVNSGALELPFTYEFTVVI